MISRHKNIKTIIAAFVTAAAISTPTLAWGPERPTYTNESPAPSATFNSITNNAAVGDEREFVRIREKDSGNNYTANTDDSGFLVEPGKTYEVYIYYHNNAASNTNESGAGVAMGTKLSTHFTYKVTPSETGYVNATITSANATPTAVWDELKLISNEEVNLNYVANSATIHNSWATNDMILVAENLFSDEGAYLGVDSLDGVIYGCAEYSGRVTYELKADDAAPVNPAPEPTCATNPEMEGCQSLPNTGPLEVVLAIIIISLIGGGGYYFYRTRKNLKNVEQGVSGKSEQNDTVTEEDSSQNPDNMIQQYK